MKRFKARAVVHYGESPEEALRDFTEKWVAVMYDRIKEMTAADLRVLGKDLKQQIDILAENEQPA